MQASGARGPYSARMQYCVMSKYDQETKTITKTKNKYIANIAFSYTPWFAFTRVVRDAMWFQ